MATNIFGVDEDESRSHVLVSVAAEVFLVCAAVLVFFAYLALPMSIAAAASLAGLFLGSLLIWQSLKNAQVVLFASLLAIEIVVLRFIEILLIPFALVDMILLALILGSRKAQEE